MIDIHKELFHKRAASEERRDHLFLCGFAFREADIVAIYSIGEINSKINHKTAINHVKNAHIFTVL